MYEAQAARTCHLLKSETFAMEHPNIVQNNLLSSKERAEHKRQQLQTINKFSLQTYTSKKFRKMKYKFIICQLAAGFKVSKWSLNGSQQQ